ncbi:alpha/beta hydrolase family protein [Larkinella soli]|uniref:alpha/beta hydrolase family protein n=1 Tax=Larkinella soli TaxID=1770527 RepID=UPI0019CFFC8C|nr:dienelactone hydrolase family protein [Larkinella soli]
MLPAWAKAQSTSLSLKPDTLTFTNGPITLKGLLWKPAGSGPFPVVLFNHGSEPLARPIGQTYLAELAPAFLDQGYAFFVPFRRGQGLSRGQGKYILDSLRSAEKMGGAQARSRLLISLHQTEQLSDQLAGLTRLKELSGIDTNRIVVAGVSFGGIQSILMAAQPVGIRAVINFAGGAMNWDQSESIRIWMKQAVVRARVPIYFIQAENDYSIRPSLELGAEMKRVNKPHRVTIYPPRGKEAKDGHTFIDAADRWGPDVFRFLEEHLKK